MGSKHSRPSPQQPVDGDSRRKPRDNQQDDEISAEARAEFTVDDIHSPANTRRAQELRASDHDRFCKYRNYFKNHHMSLAREVGRRTSKSRAELLAWVEDAVGPLQDAAQFTKDEILEIAMVSAALSEYGEPTLIKMFDRGELDALPNVPLHTHNLRMPGQQQKCRDNSDAANKDQLEAAHYIGLEVMLRLNERLPVEQRMGEELREILNHPSNLRLMLASSNQVLHKKVDTMLITVGEVSPPPASTGVNDKRQRKIAAREYDRLVQIAKHAQDEGFQDAMIVANGHYLYGSLREQFNRLDVGDRPKLWDIEKDKRELRYPPRRRSRSPALAPQRPRTPPSPEKKKNPLSRLVHSAASDPSAAEKEHHSTFSRFAAKIFYSHSKKKKNDFGDTTRSGPTAAMESNQQSHQPRPRKTKVAVGGVRDKKCKPPVKNKATKRAEPWKGKPATTRGRTREAQPQRSNQESCDFLDDDSSGDSDYVASDSSASIESDDRVDPYDGKVKAKKPTKRAEPRKPKGTAKQTKTEKEPAKRSNQKTYDESSDDSDFAVSDSSHTIERTDRVLHVGPRGGKYFINSAGKKVYVK